MIRQIVRSANLCFHIASDLSCCIQNVWQRIKTCHYVKTTIGIWHEFIVTYNMHVQTFRFYEFYEVEQHKMQ